MAHRDFGFDPSMDRPRLLLVPQKCALDDAQVCHAWKLSNGKIKSFQQYIDTAQLRRSREHG
jgi:hypothetical protein